MPKLDLTRAQQIKGSMGEILALKGPGYAWAKAWSPASLFANGEHGAWYDPSDLSTLFQDHLGTIPAAYGQPVGLMLDKSGRGNHASQAVATARPTKTEKGVQGDGVDDILLTDPIDMSHTDKITIWVVARRLNPGRVLAELGPSAPAAGAFYLSTENTYRLSMGGPRYRQRLVSEATSPVDVLVARLDRADLASPSVRLNGVGSVGDMLSSGVTGNYGATYPLALFARWTGTSHSLPNSAEIRSFGMIDRLLTPPEITQLEAYLGGLT